MATKTLEIQWDAIVTKADPDWRKEHFHPPQLPDEDLPLKRQLITLDWRNAGAYANGDWILAVGLWNDNGVWMDGAQWTE